MVDIGTVSGWLTLLLLCAGFVVFMRGGGGIALTHLREANEELTNTIGRQDTKLREAEREISELRGRTDVSLAIAQGLNPVLELSSQHEIRAQERHERTMMVLELIARRLGPDEGGTT